MKKYQRGEVTTLLVVGYFIFLGATSLAYNLFLHNKQSSNAKAASVTPRDDAIVANTPCSNTGEWKIKCLNDKGPCGTGEGVGLPLRCENNLWALKNQYGECNASCAVAAGAIAIAAPTNPPAQTGNVCTQLRSCIYSEASGCYTGYCPPDNPNCGFNNGCQYRSDCSSGVKVDCPSDATAPTMPPTATPRPTSIPYATSIPPTPTPFYDDFQPVNAPYPSPTPESVYILPTSTPTPYPNYPPTSTLIPTQPPVVENLHTVVLDPGHGYPDLDPQESKNAEGRLNILIAQKARGFLAKEGVAALLTHESNLGINSHYGDLQKRIDVVNQLADQGGELFIAIHFDASVYPFGKGPRSYFNTNRQFSNVNKRLAELVSGSISKRTNASTVGQIGTPVIGLDNDVGGCCGPLYILGPQGQRTIESKPESEIKRASKIPGILSEFFSKGYSYENLYKDPALTDQIAKGYCDGIVLYLKNKTCE